MSKAAEINKASQQVLKKMYANFEKEVKTSQKDLFNLLVVELLEQMQLDAEGLLIPNAYNYSKLNNIDKLFNEFSNTFQNKTLLPLANEMLGITTLSVKYFKELGFKKSTLDNIAKKLDYLHNRIGINKAGKVIKGSYIDRLARMETVRDKIAAYVNQAIAQRSGKTEFVKGFKDLITTNKNGIGAMQRYYKTYVHDTIYQIKRTTDNYIADQLKLGFAIYQGTIIDTSREFCLARVGQVFSREEIESWKDLEYSYLPSPYDPFIDLGGYNCRHWLDWISDELGEEMRKTE